ncbi:hypothetical protein [Brachyspira sp.]|uniref:hypothetical protein n=1 Tax=Brachyspira sp. TaxID=1977261 RepID=UPI00260FC56C|nr:hypothetical protein [Brachyspira sp.]
MIIIYFIAYILEIYKSIYSDLSTLYDAAYWRLQRDEEDYVNDKLQLYILKVGSKSDQISLCLAFEKGVRQLSKNRFEEIKLIIVASITDKRTKKIIKMKK